MRNAWDERWVDAAGPRPRSEVYSPDSRAVDGSMGALTAAVVARADRVRGGHPLCSFAGVGPSAAELLAAQRPEDVYAPLRALGAAGGHVLLLGVDLTALTLLHLAEQRAGRTLFRRWAIDRGGRSLEVECGGCSDGFGALEPALAPIRTEAVVGASRWQGFPAGPAVESAAAAMRADPQVTHCADPDCLRCRDAIAGGPFLAGDGAV